MSISEQCVEWIKEAIDLGNNKMGLYLPYPRINYNLRGTTAGKADIKHHVIYLNPVLMMDNKEDFRQTCYHEVAHLLQYKKFGYGIQPHGHEFAVACFNLGISARRCHNYDTSHITGRKPRSMCHEVTE